LSEGTAAGIFHILHAEFISPTCWIWAILLLFATENVVIAQTSRPAVLSSEVLLNRGLDVYDQLPQHVSTDNAENFAKAVQYLFAYKQRNPSKIRNDRRHAEEVDAALNWMLSNIDQLKPGGVKGDDWREKSFCNSKRLKDDGMHAFQRIPPNFNVIGAQHAEEIIVALGNLYALYQCDDKARSDDTLWRYILQLEKYTSLINTGGVKGDQFVPTTSGWIPDSRQPKPQMRHTAKRSLPDLYVSAFKMKPSKPIRNRKVYIKIGVRNRSNVSAGFFLIEWWAGEKFPEPACRWRQNGMPANQERFFSCTYKGYRSWYKELRTKVVVDSKNNVFEGSEKNNVYFKTISVRR
jgi:hypothetical protein